MHHYRQVLITYASAEAPIASSLLVAAVRPGTHFRQPVYAHNRLQIWENISNLKK